MRRRGRQDAQAVVLVTWWRALTSAPPPAQVGELYANRYRIIKKLGWGHFSTVWRAVDRITGRVVAVKFQKSASHYTEAAWDEIEILSHLKSKVTSPEWTERGQLLRLPPRVPAPLPAPLGRPVRFAPGPPVVSLEDHFVTQVRSDGRLLAPL